LSRLAVPKCLLLEHRLRVLRRTGQSQEYDQLQAILQQCSNDEFYCLASRDSQHLPASIKLIAVSKQVSGSNARSLCCWSSDFGESRVQAASKQAPVQDLPDITWHFIGSLQQSEKKTLELFQWITH